jgi:hypothetical protein
VAGGSAREQRVGSKKEGRFGLLRNCHVPTISREAASQHVDRSCYFEI